MMLPRKRQRRTLPVASDASVPGTPAAAQAAAASPSTAVTAAATAPAATSTSSLPPPTTKHQQQHQQQQMPALSPSNSQPTAQPAQPFHTRQVRKAQSWYGSWPRIPKASPSTSVARETIFGDSVRSRRGPDLGRFEPKRDAAGGDAGSSSQATSMAMDDNNNNNNSSSSSSKNSKNSKSRDDDDRPVLAEEGPIDGKQLPELRPEEGAKPVLGSEHQTSPADVSTEMATPPRPATSSGWLGWLARTPFTETQTSAAAPAAETKMEDRDGAGPPSEAQGMSDASAGTGDSETPRREPEQPATTEQPSEQPSSWFGFWGATPARSNTGPENEAQTDGKGADTTDTATARVPEPAPPVEDHPKSPKAGSTWAFWSKDSPKAKANVPSPQDAGQIAVIGEGSEAHPQPMVEDDVSQSPSKPPKENPKNEDVKARSTWRKGNKRVRPASIDMDARPTSSGQASPAKPGTPQPPSQPDQPEPGKAAQAAQAGTAKTVQAATGSEASVQAPTNLLLPSFANTYQMKDNPSIVKQITQLLLRTQNPSVNHVYRVKEPPKIRKAIAIGVHGLFPATYLRPMIGQPTGTSLRFASLCADAIRRWTDSHGCPGCEIEKVALEGEGKISERVDNLWKLLLNWIEHIRTADLILIACHSQGVPVSIMLVEKLIDLGIITSARIGVCAMAGVSLGPFTDYKSSIFMGSAAELWEFRDPQSSNSQRFEAALKRVLDYGTRITFIGSIDDQLVPMESAIYSPAHHPYIYRAAFIDGRIHAPDFIAHLVGFALKLRNLGISDHGLIRELSVPLAGSLYSGEGHSRLYFDDAVYDLAISHALETTSIPGPATPCTIEHHDGPPGQQPNPYLLPWIMRGLLEETVVKTELGHETEQLLRQFDDWKPVNKALKDVKYRLEAVRSKL